MLPDLHAQGHEGVLFALGFDHHVSLPATEGILKTLPVSAIHRVRVHAGLLGRVLAGEVKLGAYAPSLPRRQREIQRLL
jgi:hypothetical protein